MVRVQGKRLMAGLHGLLQRAGFTQGARQIAVMSGVARSKCHSPTKGRDGRLQLASGLQRKAQVAVQFTVLTTLRKGLADEGNGRFVAMMQVFDDPEEMQCLGVIAIACQHRLEHLLGLPVSSREKMRARLGNLAGMRVGFRGGSHQAFMPAWERAW